jgi:hypothetical protein
MPGMPRPVCPTCLQPIRLSQLHGLTPGLVAALKQFNDATRGTVGRLSAVITDRTSVDNFQKLKYWGLIIQVDGRGSKTGRWRVSRNGARFLSGEITVRKNVRTFHDRVVRYEGMPVFVHEIAGEVFWMQHHDYIEGQVAFSPVTMAQLDALEALYGSIMQADAESDGAEESDGDEAVS